MDQNIFDEWVSHVEWRKETYEITIGGNTSAHYQAHRCLVLLIEDKDESYLEELLNQSKYLGTSYDTVKLVVVHFLKHVPNLDEWPKRLRKWLLDYAIEAIERPRGSQKKGRQPGDHTDKGKWEAGRDYVVAWLVDYIVESGVKVTEVAEILAKVYPMSASNVLSAYYEFKKKYENRPRAQIPDPFTFRLIAKQ